MAECNLLTGGVTKGCDDNVGGLRKAWGLEKSLVTNVVHGSPGTKITVLTITGSANFFGFEFNKRSGSNYTEVEATADNGSSVNTQTLVLILSRREQVKRDALLFLGKGKELVWIVLDSNGLYWYLGENEGMELTENNGGSGAAKTDANGYTLTFVATEPRLASEITSTAALAAIGDGV